MRLFAADLCLGPRGHWDQLQVSLKKILRSARTAYLCFICGSENKQLLFSYTALTDWFL